MSNKIQIRRGLEGTIPTLDNAEFGMTEDSGKLYLGHTTLGNIRIGGAPTSTDYTIYVATTALGGTASGTGLAIKSGTTTGVAANKLIDSGGGFASSTHLNKTVYNSTADVWAKITAVDSATQLTLSADIMDVSEAYVIANAVNTVQLGYNAIENPFYANPTVRISPGTFSGDVTFAGKVPAGGYSISVRGTNAVSGTILSGAVTVYDKLTFAGGATNKLTFTNRVNLRGTANVTWSYCQTTGSSGKVFKYDNAASIFSNSIITFGNDPGTYSETSSTITKRYYGLVNATDGSDTNAENFAIHSGSATSTTANKLVDSNANFGTDVVDMVLWNSTDDTWAKVTARDSATQLSLSADIMASGESYYLGDAFATIQKAVDAIPGTVNCNTTVKVSNETFSETVTIQGKNLSGSYEIKVIGTLTTTDSGTSTGSNTNAFPITQTRFYDTGKAWTVSAYAGKLLKITGGTGSTQTYPYRIIYDNAATYADLVGVWDTLPDATSTYKVLSFGTIITSSSTTGSVNVAPGQNGVVIQHIDFTGTATAGVWSDSANTKVLGCKFRNTGGNGSYFTAGTTGEFNINYVPTGGPNYPVRIVNSFINCYHNSLVSGASQAAIFYEGASGQLASPYVKGNYLDGGAQGGIYAYGGASVSGVENCWITGGSTYGIYINHNSVARIVTNNLIENATSHGIFCNNGHVLFAVTASTTDIKNNGGWGVYGQTTSTGQSMTVPTYTTNTSGTWSFAAGSYSYGS